MVSIVPYLFTPTYLRDPPAFFHTRILVGPGSFLTPSFVEQYGITHVINCSADEFSPEWWRTQYPDKYKLIAAVDSVTVNILDWYPEFETTLQEFLRQGDGVIYVHCQAGMNRSASLALAYTSKKMGMDLQELILSVRRQRPCILQNPVFMNQVKEFVNGRIQDSENKGDKFLKYHDRYARFFASGNYPESQGNQNQTGDIAPGVRRIASGNITPLFYQ